ncbi:MAG: flippase [Candidatus Neomarinimicrobiota bacterium]
MNIAKKIGKESSITFVGLLYGNLNRYLYTALLARWVGPEFLGIYSIANSIMLISEVFAKMGLETGIMRFISRLNPELDKEKINLLIGSSLKMVSVFSLSIMIILIISSGTIVDNYFNGQSLLKPVLIIFAIAIPFNALIQISAFATQGFKRLKYKTIVTQFLNPTILLLSMVFCYWFMSKEYTIMIPILTTGVIGFLFMIIVLKKVSGFKNNQILESKINYELLKFSYPLMFVTILQTLMHWMDILMLGYFTNPLTVGLYHPAARTAGLLQALLLSFLSIYAPLAAQFHSQGDKVKLSNTYQLVNRWLLIFAIPISAVFILFPEKVLLLFGSQYLESSKVLVLLTIATFTQAILGAAGPTLSMSGHTKLVLFNSIGTFILNFGLNIWLIPIYGILGAAIATLTSLTIIGLIRVTQVYFILKINFLNLKLIKPILSGLVCYSVLIAIKPLIIEYSTFITLFIAIFTSIFVFGLILFLLKIEDEDKDILKSLNFLKGIINK